MTRRNEKIKGREGALDDECERPNDPGRGISSVCDKEKRSLFHPIHVRTIIGASVQ